MTDDERWSLRGHVRALEGAGRLVRLGRPADPDTEVSALMAELDRRRLAGVFEVVGDSRFALAYNLLGSRDMVGIALGVAGAEVADAFARGVGSPVDPVVVAGGAASQECVLEGADADLGLLPAVVHSEFDAGRYITAGMVLTRDPETGLRNISFNRMCPVGPRAAGIRMMPPQQLGQIQAKAERRGEDLPVAVAVGMHPTAGLGAAASPPLGRDELAMVGGLRREPVRLVAGVSVPIEVPAEAEFVIEGWVRCGVREPEGPFGDFLEYYVPRMDNHRLEVTAITHRRSAVYQTMHAGSREDVQILGVSREVDIVEAVRRTGARVSAVRLQPTILGAVVAIAPRYAGEGKAVAMAALGAYRWLKYCVVVDADVDVDSGDDVWWAVATRTALDRDVVVVPHAGGFPRDESGMHDARLIIDATVPLDRAEHFHRRLPPGHGRVRLEDFLATARGTGA
ncbi:UbiD family decarboxylase [Dactylosporangium sp. CA-233914]|uniref:UbiD family decarboxylase n=1 Tax=Dactylosporangium sp. CA-233914 TaxID=3239934 RepID=UPI003D92DE2D